MSHSARVQRFAALRDALFDGRRRAPLAPADAARPFDFAFAFGFTEAGAAFAAAGFLGRAALFGAFVRAPRPFAVFPLRWSPISASRSRRSWSSSCARSCVSEPGMSP